MQLVHVKEWYIHTNVCWQYTGILALQCLKMTFINVCMPIVNPNPIASQSTTIL